MNTEYLSELSLQQFIRLALAEDVGEGDHTTLSCIPKEAMGKAKLIVKEDCVLAGVNLAERIFYLLEPNTIFKNHYKDGQIVKKGDIAFEVEASVHTILKAERLALNCMQRMSGIATFTKAMTQEIAGTKAKLLDTRKTTPNFRMLEKWAVLIGGGYNHRYNLADMILIKDNHVDYAGGIKEAISSACKYIKEKNLNIPIEIETRNLQEVKEAMTTGGFKRIMFDNMDNNTMRKAVEIVNGEYETEASGGVNFETIRGIAETGVDYISVGALTHSVKSIDLSLKAIK